MREKVFVDFVVAEIEDLLYGFHHFLHIDGVDCFLLDALHVELVVDFLLYVLAVCLEIDQ